MVATNDLSGLPTFLYRQSTFSNHASAKAPPVKETMNLLLALSVLLEIEGVGMSDFYVPVTFVIEVYAPLLFF